MSRANLKWDSELDLRDLFQEYEDGDKTVAEVATELAKRLRAHKLADQFEECADEFESISDDGSDVDAFDAVMSDLYDIADYNKQCWVRTF